MRQAFCARLRVRLCCQCWKCMRLHFIPTTTWYLKINNSLLASISESLRSLSDLRHGEANDAGLMQVSQHVTPIRQYAVNKLFPGTLSCTCQSLWQHLQAAPQAKSTTGAQRKLSVLSFPGHKDWVSWTVHGFAHNSYKTHAGQGSWIPNGLL